MMKRPPTTHRGYTLIELIVSVAIFSMVMLLATAALLTLIDLDRRARATNDVVTNLSYVVDSMARSIRTGTDYSCGSAGGDCPTGRSSFSFTDYDGREVSYQMSGGTIGQCIGSTCSTLTDPRITIDTFTFYVIGSTRGDGVQPRTLFTISGSLRPHPTDDLVKFTIESSATQRLIDI